MGAAGKAAGHVFALAWRAVGCQPPPPGRPRSAAAADAQPGGSHSARVRSARSARNSRAEERGERAGAQGLGSAMAAGLRSLQAIDAAEAGA
jgi:hypothetical protein